MMAETNEGIENSVVPTVLAMIIGDRKFVPATELEAMAVELAETEAARVAVVERERKVAAMLEAATAMLEASRDILPDPEPETPQVDEAAVIEQVWEFVEHLTSVAESHANAAINPYAPPEEQRQLAAFERTERTIADQLARILDATPAANHDDGGK